MVQGGLVLTRWLEVGPSGVGYGATDTYILVCIKCGVHSWCAYVYTHLSIVCLSLSLDQVRVTSRS